MLLTVVYASCYAGEAFNTLDQDVVQDAIKALGATPEPSCAYALDLGVLSDGQTALIELNDAYGIGAYGISPKVYFDFLKARWDQLSLTIPARKFQTETTSRPVLQMMSSPVVSSRDPS
jgi:hypothetical protein